MPRDRAQTPTTEENRERPAPAPALSLAASRGVVQFADLDGGLLLPAELPFWAQSAKSTQFQRMGAPPERKVAGAEQMPSKSLAFLMCRSSMPKKRHGKRTVGHPIWLLAGTKRKLKRAFAMTFRALETDVGLSASNDDGVNYM